MIFTTSWDDGDEQDLRLADVLDRRGIRGTFYIARQYRPHRLSNVQIRNIASRHEIGAHTLSHPDLSSLSPAQQREEIEGSKRWLEDIIGKPVEMFCYPYGRFTEETKQIVREAGFIGARSMRKELNALPQDPFAMPVTVLSYRGPYTLREKLLLPIAGSRISNSGWERRVREKFDAVVREDGVFHLWGHSWEIEHLKLWKSLEEFLKEIAHRPNIKYMDNGDLISSFTLR